MQQALTIVTDVTDSDQRLTESDIIKNYGGEITLEDFEDAVYEDPQEPAPVSETRSVQHEPFLSLLYVEKTEEQKDIELCFLGIIAANKAATFGSDINPLDIASIKLQLSLGNHPIDVMRSHQAWFSRDEAIALMYIAMPELFGAVKLS